MRDGIYEVMDLRRGGIHEGVPAAATRAQGAWTSAVGTKGASRACLLEMQGEKGWVEAGQQWQGLEGWGVGWGSRGLGCLIECLLSEQGEGRGRG